MDWFFILFSVYLLYMKYLSITILFAALSVLSGCIGGESGNSTGGVFKSIDGGKTFEPSNFINEESSLARSNVSSIAIDPTDNNVVYAGTEKKDLYISRDGANSWSLLQSGLLNIDNIVINPFNTNTFYISGMYQGRGSIIKTIDGGETWDRIYVEPADGTNITAMTMSAENGAVIYLGTSGGTIAKTVNAGNTWENLYLATDTVVDLAIDSVDDNTLYALIGISDIVKSRDDGATFESIRNDIDRDSETEKLFEGSLYSMTVSPYVSGDIAVGTDSGVSRSKDYGKSWNPVDVIASTVGIPIHAMDVNPHDSSQLVYAAAKAVYTSIGDGWAITDTASNRIVDVIEHDPINSDIIYLGLKKSN